MASVHGVFHSSAWHCSGHEDDLLHPWVEIFDSMALLARRESCIRGVPLLQEVAELLERLTDLSRVPPVPDDPIVTVLGEHPEHPLMGISPRRLEDDLARRALSNREPARFQSPSHSTGFRSLAVDSRIEREDLRPLR